MRQVVVTAGLVLSGMAFSQPQAELEFEVASVRAVGAGNIVRGLRGGPETTDPTRFTAVDVDLRTLVSHAYGLPLDQLSVPSWFANEQHTIVAKVPPGATKEQFHVMLQDLLAQRFKMTLHREKKDLTVYEMVAAKNGLTVKESVADATPAPHPIDVPARSPAARDKEGFVMLEGNTSRWTTTFASDGRRLITARQVPMATVATILRNGTGARVVDKTGLTGKYDFRLQYQVKTGLRAAALDYQDEPAPDIFTAAQQQLGLLLTKGKLALDVLVVDRAEKVPIGN
jgi:uncharacterized protein (TIGR03435 family)